LGKINKEKPWKENMRTKTEKKEKEKMDRRKNDRKKLNCRNAKRLH
jgi:hypothetical protein